MKIVVCGGGPSGLYFALLAKKRFADADITVFEQNPSNATYGFGVVLADRGLNRFQRADADSYKRIMDACFVSRHRIIIHRGERIFIEGGGYGAAIARLRLLNILQDCCREAGVTLRPQTRIDHDRPFDADLIVGADGVNSEIRRGREPAFGTTSYLLSNKLAWYGTTHHFPYPLLSFKTTERGHFWAAAYAYTENMGTFVAECDADTWINSGLSGMSEVERQSLIEDIFAEELGGRALISNKSLWHSLPVTRNRNWYAGNRVLIGDALHSAHPTIGSGTRIAMEDSIALVEALEANADIPEALAAFQYERAPAKQKLVDAAEKSFMWYENIAPRMDTLDPAILVFDFMMRTGRIDEQRLIAEYPEFMDRYSAEWQSFAAA
jgi:2-polyprenyl-6-methoxyphenol hydroxylase-like FAD-dependent oxidoreductase